MGDRAVITASKEVEFWKSNDMGVYLHWNGDITSVTAFLEYCRAREIRPPADAYGWARLCQVIGNYFGGSLSVGIDKCRYLDCDNYDNGTYIIDGWDIVDRQFVPDCEKEVDLNRFRLMLTEIDLRQPDHMGEDALDDICRAYVKRTKTKDCSKLIETLRICGGNPTNCDNCPRRLDGFDCDDRLILEAADAIEELTNRIKELEAQND